MSAEATTAPPTPFVPSDPTSGEIFLHLNAEGRAAQADVRWIDEQFNLGAFRDYYGEFVAVVGKKLLGHNKDLLLLREEVSHATGFSPSRIVTSFIEAPDVF